MISFTALRKSRLMQAVLGSGGLGLVHRGAGLVTAIVLARILGAEGYGYYAFALGVAGILAVPAQLGLPQLMTRELAARHAHEQWSLMAGLRRRAFQIAAVSVLLAMLVGVFFLLNAENFPALEPRTFALGLALLPLLISMELLGSVLRGLRRVLHAQWPIAAFKPLLVLLLIVVGASLLELTPAMAMLFNVVASLLAVGLLVLWMRRHWPRAATAASARYDTRAWLRSLLPFTALGAANVIVQKTDVAMLGWLTGPADVGVYNIVVQGAMLVSFGFSAVNAVIAPTIARSFAKDDLQQLQRLLSMSSLIVLAIAVVVMVVFVLFGKLLLGTVFGSEFTRGFHALLILGVGQLVNASVGSVGTFLSMTRHENDTLRAIVIAAIANVILNLFLIPRYGIVGAAVATMISTVLWNIIMSVAVHQRLGLVPGPFFFKQNATTNISGREQG